MPLRSQILASLLIAALAGGCGGEAAPAEAGAEERSVALDDPLAEIPPEELYGASPEDNLWTPRFEFDVVDLPVGWDGGSIAVVSDLNLGMWEGNTAAAAAAIQRAVDSGADVIALLGDYLAAGGDPAELRQVLAPLGGRRAVGVLGERDVRSDSAQAMIAAALRSAGVTILENTAAPVVRGGDTLYIAGLDPGLVGESGGDREYILATVGQPGPAPVLLTHLPGLAAGVPNGRFPVVIAGDTFCGSVDVPGSRRLSSIGENLFPGGEVEGIDRLFRVRGQTVVITCGVGYGFVPIRFGAPPEVPIITLRRLGGAEPEAPAAPAAVEDSVIERFQAQQATPPDSL